MPDTSFDLETINVRRPPQSVESEQALLGGLLLDNSAYETISNMVVADDFCRRDHRVIFEHIISLIQRGRPADVITVYESTKNAGQEDEVGGFVYLNELVDNTPSAANIHRYAEIIRDKSVLRQLVTLGDKISTKALMPEGMEPREILEQAERDVLSINDKNARGRRGFQDMSHLVQEVSQRITELYQNQSASDVTGIATGYPNLDKVTAGLQRGDLIIVAGRPSMGKTTLAMNIAENIGVHMEVPVAVFSMEMGADQLAQRLISGVGRIDAQTLRKGRLTDEDWENFTKAITKLEKSPIYIDDTPGLTVSELASRARRLHSQVGQLGVIVVDYIQLMSGSARASNENRSTEISEISRGLKGLAKELNVPVIVLSQLNRSVDSRTDRRPVMSDLRESGAIEQDADIIMFIYRDVVYNKETPNPNQAEIIIAKQRNGPIGTLRMTFLGGTTRFEACADEGFFTGNE